MLRRSNNSKPNKWNLKSKAGSKNIEYRISNIHPHVKLLKHYQSKHIDRDDVNDEAVASPGSNHVEVGEAADHAPFD